MRVTWLVQSNMQNKAALTQMHGALKDAGIATVSVDLVPFADEIPVPDELDCDRQLVCWGPSFVPRALCYLDLQPGIWFDPIAFRWSTALEKWGALMMNGDASVVPFDKAVAALEPKPAFMRPDDDSKAFNGGVYDVHAPPRLRGGLDASAVATVIAPLRYIKDEWRFFVVDGTVVAATSYRVQGQPEIGAMVATEAVAVAQEAIQAWCPAKVFCLDVGFDGARFGVIEVN